MKIPESVKKILRPVKHLFIARRDYSFYSSLSDEEQHEEALRQFKSRFRKELTRENAKTFNEKIQWLRIFDNTSIKSEMADKVTVRKHVAERIGEKYLNKIWGPYDSFSEINFQELPDRFVIKCNHGCGYNIVVQDKSKMKREDIQPKLEQWMSENYALFFLEFQYKPIVPKIFVEEFIENKGGNLYDYKVHCFNGEPRFIQYIGDRMTSLTQEIFLDVNWIPQPFTYTYTRYDLPPPKPECLKELLLCAKKMAQDFIYARVDFYILDNGEIRFGEMTFTPAGGFDHWNPKEWDLKLGNLIHLPETEHQ